MKELIIENKISCRINEFKTGRQTIFFVHGLSGSSSAWLPYEKFFSDDYNIVSMDIRGHGKSRKFKDYGDYELEKMAGDIRAAADYFRLPKFILICHSFAALIAFEFIAKHQNILEAVVFLSPNFSVGQRPIELAAKPFIKLAAKIAGFFPFSEKPGGRVDYEKYPMTGDWNIRRMLADVPNTTLRVTLYGTLQTYGKNYGHLLEKIKIPTLLIHGKKDTIFPVGQSIYMSQKIKNSKLLLLPLSDHIIVLNNFPEVSKEIAKFLKENSL